MELLRTRGTMERTEAQHKVLKDPGKFTPFAFPIIVDRLREKLSREQLQGRIRNNDLTLGEVEIVADRCGPARTIDHTEREYDHLRSPYGLCFHAPAGLGGGLLRPRPTAFRSPRTNAVRIAGQFKDRHPLRK
ncbi:MAG: hypothetical protein IPM12_16315 [Flavobacteriales bacterium]|nr:hypothetical protein [Flavobacteriales bacterium]